MTETNKKQKVIILDDDEFLLNMYTTKFQSEGIEADFAKSGNELVEKLKGGAVADALLLDVIMPGATGLETLAELRKQNLVGKAKVVMLTNQSDPEDINTAKSLDISGYIVKATSTPSEVVEEVKKIMNL